MEQQQIIRLAQIHSLKETWKDKQAATDYSEEKATEILSQEKVTAIADLKAGDAEATAWGCDLTHGYIDINADYRS